MEIRTKIKNMEVTMYGTFKQEWDPWACITMRYSDGTFRNITDATMHQVKVVQAAIIRTLESNGLK